MSSYPAYRYRSPFRFIYWLLILVVIALIYVASIGPVVNFQSKGWLPNPSPPLLADFYAPVGWLYDNTFMRRPLEIYLQWWTDFDALEFAQKQKARQNEQRRSQGSKDTQEN